MKNQEMIRKNIGAFSAFLFFSIALSLPSGYSWGAALISLIAIFSIPLIIKNKASKDSYAFALFFIVCGFFWSNTFDAALEFNKIDYIIKYALGALTILYLDIYKPSRKSIQWGLIIGGISTTPLAIYQFYTIGRANGFTNAIQFGDIAIIFSIGNFLFFLYEHENRTLKNLALVAALTSLFTSLVSLSRGGWLVIPVFFIIIIAIEKEALIKKKIICSSLFLVMICVAFFLQSSFLKNRLIETQNQVSQSLQNTSNNATTSVGQRLEQWKLAWQLGNDRPISGWGDKGLIAAKKSYVNRGLAHPSVMDYGHAHNEFLDNWARRGSIGFIFLFFIYITPFYFFKIRSFYNEKIDNGLRYLGFFIPISYAIFGLTQVFFSHNSGHLFYIFSLAFIWSALSHKQEPPTTKPH